MAINIYECPYCGEKLEYNATTHIFHCDHCRRDYTKDELEEKRLTEEEQSESRFLNDEQKFEKYAALYSCPNCGVEMLTDDKTSVGSCYYCHGAVVPSEGVAPEYKPDYIIPFKVSRESAEKKMIAISRKKKLMPSSFINRNTLDTITGVYFPYWITSCSVKGIYSATGKNIKVTGEGDVKYTETSVYDIKRSGDLYFKNLKNCALKGEQAKIIVSVQPYRDGDIEKFRFSDFEGCISEVRNVEKDEFSKKMNRQINAYSKKMFEESIGGYDKLPDRQLTSAVAEEKWECLLLPAWVLTYTIKGKTYFCAVNGQTGKVSGEFPICKIRLTIILAAVFLILFLIVMGIGGLVL